MLLDTAPKVRVTTRITGGSDFLTIKNSCLEGPRREREKTGRGMGENIYDRKSGKRAVSVVSEERSQLRNRQRPDLNTTRDRNRHFSKGNTHKWPTSTGKAVRHPWASGRCTETRQEIARRTPRDGENQSRVISVGEIAGKSEPSRTAAGGTEWSGCLGKTGTAVSQTIRRRVPCDPATPVPGGARAHGRAATRAQKSTAASSTTVATTSTSTS